ncbi:MlaD family protein [Rhodococcus triatomae]|nr:putative Mce family protein [Rhodococcus triatomae BKS 15-14]
MLRSWSRWQALVVAAVVTAVLAGGVVVLRQSSTSDTRSLCAQLSDSAGLYAGNAVNIRGVKVGRVTEVTPDRGHVTVRMTIDDRPVAADVRVLAVNNSVLADRRLELVGAEATGGAELDPDECVPLSRTATPISVSTAFDSFTTMFDEIGGAGPDSSAPVGNALAAASGQLRGTGGDLNRTIENLAGFMSDPDEFLARMRTVFDNLTVLTDLADENWTAITDVGRNAASLTNFMGVLFGDFADIFIGFGRLGVGLDHLLSDHLAPLLESIPSGGQPVDPAAVANLTAITQKLPAITTGLTAAVGRRPGAISLDLQGPRFAADASDATCLVLNQVEPGSCDPQTGNAAVVDLPAVVASAIQGGGR